MNIYILNPSLEVVDIIDDYENIIWTTRFFSSGDFSLQVPATEKNLNRLIRDYYLCREEDINDGEYRNVMIIKNINLVTDYENGNTLTVTGKSLKSIVGQRIIWEQTNLSGNIEKGIRHVIEQNIISPSISTRKIPNFMMEEEHGYTQTFDVQSFGENIETWLETVCTTNEIGWDVYIKDGNYVFALMDGVDRSYQQDKLSYVVFSPEFDNLLTTNYQYTKESYSNCALIGGEGEGISQRTAHIGDYSGLQRFESYIDGSSVSSNGEIITVEQYEQMLRDYGNEQLNQTAFTESFDGTVDYDGNYKLNEDFFLGDTVTIINEFGMTANPRIVEIIDSEDQNGRTVIPTFSAWEVE